MAPASHVNADVEQALREARIGRLATVDERGAPHIVPIVFAYQGGRLFTALDAKPKLVAPSRLRRVRNILRNPQVQVLIDHYEEDWARLWYIQIRGDAELIAGGEEHERACRLLEAKYPQYASLPLAGRPIIEIEIVRVVTWGF